MDKVTIEDVRAGKAGEVLLADGLDPAFIGLEDGIAVYDEELIIQVFMDQGMERGEAVEFFEFNVRGAYVGPKTPIYIDTSLDIQDEIAKARELW